MKPFTSAPHVWTLARKRRVDGRYCTANEEPEVYKNLESEDEGTVREERPGRHSADRPWQAMRERDLADDQADSAVDARGCSRAFVPCPGSSR